MNKSTLPVLYSFRRCPYAIRARIALHYSGVNCELREVVLKSKPPALLAVSPKATVPVLVVNSGPDKQALIDESIEIVGWALEQSDPDNWLEQGQQSIDHDLIKSCDGEFKYWLDRYKYADRFPEQSQEFYFEKASIFLSRLEAMLVSPEVNSDQKQFYLQTPKVSVLDITIFSFVRQFAFVDKNKFDTLPLPKLQIWLAEFLESDIFLSVMAKYPMWVEGESKQVIFGPVISRKNVVN